MMISISEKLKSKCIGIAGAGGLGSNCAVALARVGIGKLIIADFDVVSQSNLNRQYYFTDQLGQKKTAAIKENLYRINPDVEVIVHDIKLDSESIIRIYKDCDIIVEAFDLAEMKQMIMETVLHKFPDKPLISGLGVAGWGNNNEVRTRQIGNLFICGDEQTEVSDTQPPLAPKVGIAANMQANQVLELILNDKR